MKLRNLVFAAVLAPALAFANDTHSTQAATNTSDNANRAAPGTLNGVSPATGDSMKGDMKLTDSQLASMFHKVNKAEMEAGKLAQKEGSSAAMKDYGRQLFNDHKQADLKLEAAAKKDHLKLDDLTPMQKDKLATDDKKMDQVKSLHGADFDRGFASVMYNGHKDVLDMISQHMNDVQSKDLMSWMHEAQPKLEHHRDMAKKMMGNEKAQGRSAQPLSR